MEHKVKHKEHHIPHKHRHVKLKRKNIWKSASIALAILLIISIYTGGFRFSKDSATTGTVLTKGEASAKALDYVNKYLLTGATATLKGVEEDDGMYVLKLNIQDREFDSYITKNGELLFPQGIDMTIEPETAQQPQAEAETVTADPKDIESFVSCLKEANLKIYGANWCGWTNKLVTMFGGFDVVGPIYIECTEDKELCSEAGVGSYPTIFVGDEKYTGSRDFNGFAEATGCSITTNMVVTESAGSEAPSCG